MKQWEQRIQEAETTAFTTANPDVAEEDITAHVTEFMEANAEAIETDAKAFAITTYGEDLANEMEAAVNEYIASEEGQDAITAAVNEYLTSKEGEHAI